MDRFCALKPLSDQITQVRLDKVGAAMISERSLLSRLGIAYAAMFASRSHQLQAI